MEWLMPDEDSKYTKSDLKIMEFIENYTDEFLFMSIGQLAKRLDLSEQPFPDLQDISDTQTSRT